MNPARALVSAVAAGSLIAGLVWTLQYSGGNPAAPSPRWWRR